MQINFVTFVRKKYIIKLYKTYKLKFLIFGDDWVIKIASYLRLIKYGCLL